jgi:hypothetical protein
VKSAAHWFEPVASAVVPDQYDSVEITMPLSTGIPSMNRVPEVSVVEMFDAASTRGKFSTRPPVGRFCCSSDAPKVSAAPSHRGEVPAAGAAVTAVRPEAVE